MSKVVLYRDGNCFYLTQSVFRLKLYERTKEIKKFMDNETKILEQCVDTEIKAIFERNGINTGDTTESALKLMFDTLKSKGKEIVVEDLYKDKKLDGCVVVGTSKNKMTIVLEDNELLQCGIMVEEREIK